MAEKKAAQRPAKEFVSTAKPVRAAEPNAARSNLLIYIGIIVVVIAVVLLLYFLIVPNLSGVPFSVFKSNFDSSNKVALVTAYSNGTQFAYEYACMTKLSGVISARQSGTIDFMFIDRSNSSCVFSSLTLPAAQNYHGINETSKSAAACLSIADTQPSIFLNYSNSNYTRITPNQFFAYGNEAYFQSCPIAVDVS